MQQMVKKGVLETLIPLGSTSTATPTVLAVSPGITKHTFTARPDNGTFSAGAIQFEASDNPAYTGTWIAIGSPITLVSNTEIKVSYDGPLSFIRGRISTTITGGGTAGAFYLGSE